MIKTLINGCNGKMGQVLTKQIASCDNIMVLCGVDKFDTGDNPYPVYTNIESICETPDVIIDFSIPEASLKILEFAVQKNIPTVIATTGFLDNQLEVIKESSKVIPIFKSANMSFDINLIIKILRELTPYLADTDIEITETHHNRKIDSPSGTALLIADNINKSLGNKMNYVFDRHNIHEKRAKNEIGFSSIRGGNIVGEHSIQFFGENETLEIKHTSYSRTVFADGAIKAATFLENKAPGLYNMDDLLKTN